MRQILFDNETLGDAADFTVPNFTTFKQTTCVVTRNVKVREKHRRDGGKTKVVNRSMSQRTFKIDVNFKTEDVWGDRKDIPFYPDYDEKTGTLERLAKKDVVSL